jgi:hypothetical protein
MPSARSGIGCSTCSTRSSARRVDRCAKVWSLRRLRVPVVVSGEVRSVEKPGAERLSRSSSGTSRGPKPTSEKPDSGPPIRTEASTPSPENLDTWAGSLRYICDKRGAGPLPWDYRHATQAAGPLELSRAHRVRHAACAADVSASQPARRSARPVGVRGEPPQIRGRCLPIRGRGAGRPMLKPRQRHHNPGAVRRRTASTGKPVVSAFHDGKPIFRGFVRLESRGSCDAC